MKQTFNLSIVLGVLFLIGLAGEFSTVNLKDINFSTDYENKSRVTFARLGETFYAHSAIRNTSGKHTVEWKVTSASGEELNLPQRKVELEGSKSYLADLKVKPGSFSIRKIFV